MNSPDIAKREREALLTKLGFSLKGDKAVHGKMGVEISLAEIASYPTEKELDTYLKSVLRNQCLVRKSKR